MSVKELLENLTKEEMKILSQELKSILSVEPKQKRQRKKKNTTVQAIDINEEVPIPTPTRQNKRSRRPKRHTSSHVGTIPARIEPIDTRTPRENLFLKHRKQMAPVSQEELDAIKFDKQVSRKHQPTTRRQKSLIEVECDICNKWFQVSKQLVRTEGQELLYTCNNCQIHQRR